ncbi:DUF1173 family protein [Trinickia dinghuensis]|uniref:DUF1173 family protein n=1 Tax=Trinickia dinghuensis TaxID=2291023 RepID=A0A3D8K0G1_9BURK|nr:DUF1173 family protein [Trinickia dinghuensis]RDU98917.1 DUF1173 family protein [Trinickia dinghuensis]
MIDSFETQLKTYSQKFKDDLIILGIAEPGKIKPYATISSVVAMPVVHSQIPYDSGYERDLALHLISEERAFRKPLRYDAKEYMQVHPDFVLLDTTEPVVVEVYGMNTKEYLARKKEKQEIYSKGEYPFDLWEWNAVDCRDLGQWLATTPLPVGA